MIACTCTDGALRIFISNLAKVELETLGRSPLQRQRGITVRGIRTPVSIRLQHTTANKIYNPAATQSIPDTVPWSPFDLPLPQIRGSMETKSCKEQATHSLKPGRRHINERYDARGTSQKQLFPASNKRWTDFEDTETGQQDKELVEDNHCSSSGDSAILEISPKTIDALAPEPLFDTFPMITRGRPKEFTSNSSSSSVAAHSRRDVLRRSPTSNNAGSGHWRSVTARSGSKTADVKRREPWQIQKAAIKEKFEEGWNPRKRLSPDALEGIRAIHAQFPEQYTTSVLAAKFAVSPEVIRRILKSRWTPSEEEEADRKRRWFSRGENIWVRYAELGMHPPARWRKLGVGRREITLSSSNITVRGPDQASQDNDEPRVDSLSERIL